MPDFLISTPKSRVWQVWLADCTREHAESVLTSLESDPTVPSDLQLEERRLHDQPRLRRRRWFFWRS